MAEREVQVEGLGMVRVTAPEHRGGLWSARVERDGVVTCVTGRDERQAVAVLRAVVGEPVLVVRERVADTGASPVPATEEVTDG